MLGDGIVSLGTAVVTRDFRNVKSSPKIVSPIRILLPTRIDAGVNWISPALLRNFTARLPGALEIPPGE